MRVVSLTCSNTEIVCALGAAGELVGVDDHSDFPEEVVRRLPRVGPDLGIDIAKVRALKPDLVLASLTVPGHERVVAARLAHVYAEVHEVAARLGCAARGAALVAELTQAFAAPAAIEQRRPRILVEWWPKPVIVPGRDSWVSDLIALAGGENPLAQAPVKSRPITDEEARALDPDAVVIAWCGVRPEKYRPQVVYRRAAWQGLRALAERQVHCIPEAFLGRPGPRLVHGLAALRAVVGACAR
jgi:iron complex transport system substrate-binding protein